MIYVNKDEQQYGPFEPRDLVSYVQAGNFSRNDLAWMEGMTDWLPVSQVLGAALPPPAAIVPTPTTAVVSPGPQVIVAQNNAHLLYESTKKNPWVAVLMNFVLPGTGYMYAGMWILGIFVLIAWAVCIPFTLGIGSGIIWVLGLIDGFLAVGRANRKLAQRLLAQ